nr:hypothetical protein [Tanacetum cinerariifolium]
ANKSIKNDTLAALYGKYNYKEGMIDQIYDSKTTIFSIHASSSKALIFNTQFLENDLDVKEDTRSSSEFLNELNVEFHDRALLANQKRYYKRSGELDQPRNILTKLKKHVLPMDFKGKYKGLKAEIAFLTKKINSLSKSKSKKGLVAKSSDWNEESVSFEDEGLTKVKAFIAIAEEKPSVGKNDTR